ncbi:MAG: TIGR03943 family protein [Anaerolineae bacterium]|nr:TIGR03943 family protein [Anaerolineae bacterium]
MTRDVQRFLRILVLLSLAAMMYAKLSDGSLAFYINRRFAWLSLLAVVLLVLLALSATWQWVWQQRRGRAMQRVAAEEEKVVLLRPLQKLGEHRLSVGALLLLLLPAAAGLLVPPRPLGASAVEMRGIGAFAPERPASIARLASGEPSNILDWLRAFARESDPAAFAGRAVDVVGFVYKDPRAAKNEFWVARFMVSCCVADAAAVGLLVRSDQAPNLPADTWVRVVGRFGVGTFAGERVPLILAERVEPTAPPAQPYLYP